MAPCYYVWTPSSVAFAVQSCVSFAERTTTILIQVTFGQHHFAQQIQTIEGEISADLPPIPRI